LPLNSNVRNQLMNQDVHSSRIKKLGASGKSSLLLWPVLLLSLLMGFGGPDSEKAWWLWLLLLIVISLPFAVFIAPHMAQTALNNGLIVRAYIVILVPMLILLSPLMAPFVWWLGYAVF